MSKMNSSNVKASAICRTECADVVLAWCLTKSNALRRIQLLICRFALQKGVLKIVHLSRIWQHFSDVVYSFCVRYMSQKSELWNNHWKQACGSRKVSTNWRSKTPTIDISKCYWGYTLVDWNPWFHFWGIKCFLFLFRMCHAIFRE